MPDRTNFVSLLRDGHYPSRIAQATAETTATVVRSLRSAVGHGELRLTDIYFSWPADKRAVMQELSGDAAVDPDVLKTHDLSEEEFELFAELRRTSMFRADMYDYVSRLEVMLHDLVRDCLVREFGDEDSGWWRKGVSENIRQSCAMKLEGDDDPDDHPFSYTTLIDLNAIIDKKWGNLFIEEVPDYYRNSRPDLKSDFNRLNGIRNSVMHPVKRRKLREEDFEFVREMYGRFDEKSASKG